MTYCYLSARRRGGHGAVGFALGLLAAAFLLPSASARAQSCGCDVSDALEARYDSLLYLTRAEIHEAERTHLPFGAPVGGPPDAVPLAQRTFLELYDPGRRVPTWVAYRLTAGDLSVTRNRTECFRRDPRLSDIAASFCPDYVEPTFDRGHLVPSSDMVRSEGAMIDTYLLSNMAPQYGPFNQRLWRDLEYRVKVWAEAFGTVWVITGTIFDGPPSRMQSNNGNARVWVPSAFYKILARVDGAGCLKVLAILLPHAEEVPSADETPAYLSAHVVSVDEIEAKTGLDFFSALPDMVEAPLEALPAPALWPDHQLSRIERFREASRRAVEAGVGYEGSVAYLRSGLFSPRRAWLSIVTDDLRPGTRVLIIPIGG